MPLSMYDASVPVFKRGLGVLSTLIAKGEAHGGDAAALVGARLAPDMLTFAGQVQRANDSAKFAAARLTGGTGPSFPDDETTLAQLRDRCTATIAYLDTVTAEAFEGSETRSVTFGGGDNKWTLVGTAYLLSFALPNFYFHVTTAYDILRHQGVAIGKRDYLGPFS